MAAKRFRKDRAGFPEMLVYLPDDRKAYVHWLPVTKIQFEYFLCDRPGVGFNQGRYEELLGANDRISPREVTADNYWMAFLTAILPEEAQTFAGWCGEGGEAPYVVPSAKEWFDTYQGLKGQPPLSPEALLAEWDALQLKPRLRTLIENVERAAAQVQSRLGARTLADQLLLRQGVLEWVGCPNHVSGWGILGQPNRRIRSGLFNIDAGQPTHPSPRERFSAHGFRLIQPLP